MSRIGLPIGSLTGAPRLGSPRWLWQQPDWLHFRWRAEALPPLPRDCLYAQGQGVP
ncbi:MAG TPA: DUF4172 domain-containing protein [Rhodanobacter sp.]|nr:DUF4172 domain-containing protein [Rhodanobacter sp.]